MYWSIAISDGIASIPMRWWSGLWRERSSVSIFFQSLSSRSGTFRERVGNVGGGMTVVREDMVRMNIWRNEVFGVGVFPELLSSPKYHLAI